MSKPPPHPLAVRFADVATFLVQSLWEALRRGRISAPVMGRMGRRLNRMRHRFAALLAHLVKFGVDMPPRTYHRQPRPAPATATAPATPPGAAQDTPAQGIPPQGISPQGIPPQGQPAKRHRFVEPPLWQAVRVPRRRAWMIGISLDINCAHGRLERLLHDPELAALLAASPRLVALLRPLCRMLCVNFPPGVPPPPPPRKPRAKRRRRWHPPRRCDLLFLLRMGKPLPES